MHPIPNDTQGVYIKVNDEVKMDFSILGHTTDNNGIIRYHGNAYTTGNNADSFEVTNVSQSIVGYDGKEE